MSNTTPTEYGAFVKGNYIEPSDQELDHFAKRIQFTNTDPIPAGYTYLGQFVAHDLSFDSFSAGGVMPFAAVDRSALRNHRTPILDLEIIYGRLDADTMTNDGLFRFGKTVSTTLAPASFDNDIPRDTAKGMPLIYDPRNDENLFVSQLQVAFMKFHNAAFALLRSRNPGTSFDEVREFVSLHYQHVIIHDLLPRFVKGSTLSDFREHGTKVGGMSISVNGGLPREFSFAALRTAHSMIRPTYNWNRFFNLNRACESKEATITSIRKQTSKTGAKDGLLSEWPINWYWFFPFKNRRRVDAGMFNFAERFDTKYGTGLANPLNYDRNSSIAAMDLFRGRSLGLTSGQNVASVLVDQREILHPSQIRPLLPYDVDPSFGETTPLLFYLLAEAEVTTGGVTLGELGSRILIETLSRTCRSDVADGSFRPDAELVSHGKFTMVEMLEFVRENNPRKSEYDDLNPTLSIKGVPPSTCIEF